MATRRFLSLRFSQEEQATSYTVRVIISYNQYIIEAGWMLLNPELIDEKGCIHNSYEAAMAIRRGIQAQGSLAIPLRVGRISSFHISFVDLDSAVPMNVKYEDGSARGLQINIDRHGSFAVPWDQEITSWYVGAKWLRQSRLTVTGAQMWAFINTVITGENFFVKEMPWLKKLNINKAELERA